MSGALNRYPLGVDAAAAGTKGLPIGRVRIGPGVSRAVHDQQPTGVRDQVGVVAQPPWCQRHTAPTSPLADRWAATRPPIE